MKQEIKKFWEWAVLVLVSKPLAFVSIVIMLDYMQKHPEQQLQLSISCLLISLAVVYVYLKFGIMIANMIFKKKVIKK